MVVSIQWQQPKSVLSNTAYSELKLGNVILSIKDDKQPRNASSVS